MTLWRVRATVDDRPGYLAVLIASLALRSINIRSVQVHGTPSGAVDDFLVDAPDVLGADDLLAAVERGRGRDAWVRRADARRLVDPPNEALGVARRVVRDPESRTVALADRPLATAVHRSTADATIATHARLDDPVADPRPPSRVTGAVDNDVGIAGGG